MSNKREILDGFGKILVRDVRDSTINVTYMIMDGKAKSQRCQDLHKEISSFSSEQVETLKRFINSAVDSVLHRFLWMIEEQEDVDLVVYDRDKKPVSLKEVSDGLCGEIYTEEGWIERFSKFPPSIK